MFSLKKTNPKIPYLVSTIFPTSLWAILSAAFGAFLILSRANFEATGTRTVFIICFPIVVIAGMLIAFIEYGALRIIGIKKKEKEYIRILNDNIVGGRLLPGLPIKTVKRIFYILTARSKEALRAEYGPGVFIISLVLLIEYLASGGKTTNLPIMLISGLISYFLVILFGSFFGEITIYPIVKQCRKILGERGEEIKEFQLVELRKRFNFFLLILAPIVVAILISYPSFSPNIIIFSGLGLIIAIIVQQTLSSSICKAFLEIESFARELSQEKKIAISTGSLNKEIVSLSESLNRAANEIYTSRQKIEQRTKELEKSYQEIKKRKEELERFYNLAAGRELRMAELEKETERLKEKLSKRRK